MKSVSGTKLTSYLIILLAVSLGFLPIVLAETTTKQDSSINLIQTCNNCTYCNITKILNPSQLVILNNLEMTKDGSSFNYTLIYNYTNQIGIYDWYYDCGNLEESATGKLSFTVTPTGYYGSLLGFYILILIIPWVLFLFGLWKREISIAILATFIFYLVALFIIPFGIDGVKNNLTYGIGFVYLGFAIFTSIKYAHEMLT